MDRFVNAAALPPLRDELRLLPAAANHDGSPAWLVQDPVNNRFFRIGWIDFELLLRWRQGSVQQILDAIRAETTLAISADDVHELVQFLERHNLIRVSTAQAVDRLIAQSAQIKKSGYEWLIQHYLFFRVPLVRPQFFLKALHSRLRGLFTSQCAWALLIITLFGIFLVSRQWDKFAVTFVDQLTWSGLVGFSLALIISKALHEMGHALCATHYGVRVAHMGIALVVLFPMLYTDTSESWKLQDPRQRLAIASAGILTELALAGVATLCWSLAPESSVKSALFFLATTSWILTLGINASPFMRFDGYFILSDFLDLPNLHERSMALARTWLRRQVLGANDVWPERLPGYGNQLMIGFALLTWLYRAIVFVGIALLVYHFFFKVLGILLFVVEFVVFLLQPLWSELKVWYARRGELSRRRKSVGVLCLIVSCGIILPPWQTSVQGAGWLHAARQQTLHSPLSGRLLSLAKEGNILEGQTLFVLESPDFTIAADRAQGLAQARAKELLGLAGLPHGEERRARVQLEREKFLAEADLYQRDQSRMKLIAPFSGVLLDLDALLSPNVWVQPRQQLAILVDPSVWVADIFVAESDVSRIRAGDRARVQVNSPMPYYLSGQVAEVDASRVTSLPHHMLDASSGGPIATLTTAGNENAPRDSIYRVRILLNEVPNSLKSTTCTGVIDGERRSLLLSFLERTASILIRESGF